MSGGGASLWEHMIREYASTTYEGSEGRRPSRTALLALEDEEPYVTMSSSPWVYCTSMAE